MTNSVDHKPSPALSKIVHGRDELNLAEFPLSSISTRMDPNQKTMVFEDKIWDKNRREMVTRKLTIAASAEYGLPTALDDEIVLGLIQLSKFYGFQDRKVHFSRYQLIQILGWRDESRSYSRIEESLNRWLGVTLFYDKAWWNKEEQCWVNEKFHILDNVTLLDKERRKAKKANQADLPFSSFTWNDIIFQSFRSGNLKSLNFEYYKELEGTIAKRLYRFLDKRFYFRNTLVFNLKELAWEHIGLSRKYDVANLKRKLLAGIKELENTGYLIPTTTKKRFRKVQAGAWEVVFQKKETSKALETESSEESRPDLVQALILRGVTESVSKEIVTTVDPVLIEEKIEVFDWLREQKDPQVINPGGFLVASIRNNYEAPQDYETPEERAKKEAEIEAKRQRTETLKKLQKEEEALKKELEQKKQLMIDNFWNSLSSREQEEMRTTVIETMDDISKEMVKNASPLAEVLVKAAINTQILETLQKKGANT